MVAYNVKLKNWLANEPSRDAGIDNIQKPGDVDHVIWQTRAHEPNLYEQNLISHLIRIFGSGVEALDEVVDALNQKGMRHENGERWTVGSFQQEMSRLGH